MWWKRGGDTKESAIDNNRELKVRKRKVKVLVGKGGRKGGGKVRRRKKRGGGNDEGKRWKEKKNSWWREKTPPKVQWKPSKEMGGLWNYTWGFAKGDAICTSRLLLFTPSNFFELFEIFKPLHLLSYHHLGTIFPLPFNLIMFLLGPKMCKTISYDWKMLLIWIA